MWVEIFTFFLLSWVSDSKPQSEYPRRSQPSISNEQGITKSSQNNTGIQSGYGHVNSSVQRWPHILNAGQGGIPTLGVPVVNPSSDNGAFPNLNSIDPEATPQKCYIVTLSMRSIVPPRGLFSSSPMRYRVHLPASSSSAINYGPPKGSVSILAVNSGVRPNGVYVARPSPSSGEYKSGESTSNLSVAPGSYKLGGSSVRPSIGSETIPSESYSNRPNSGNGFTKSTGSVPSFAMASGPSPTEGAGVSSSIGSMAPPFKGFVAGSSIGNDPLQGGGFVIKQPITIARIVSRDSMARTFVWCT